MVRMTRTSIQCNKHHRKASTVCYGYIEERHLFHNLNVRDSVCVCVGGGTSGLTWKGFLEINIGNIIQRPFYVFI